MVIYIIKLLLSAHQGNLLTFVWVFQCVWGAGGMHIVSDFISFHIYQQSSIQLPINSVLLMHLYLEFELI